VLIGEDFVFLHIPKTGGTFVQRVLVEHMSHVETGLYTHTPYSEVPAHARALPGFYVVRNPWDWYVSWFHWSSQRGRELGRNAGPIRSDRKRFVWENMLRRGEADFEEAVRRACSGEFDHPTLPTLGADLYSASVTGIAGEALERPDFAALRFEGLRKQLRGYIRGHAGVDRELLAAIRNAPPARTSEHAGYRQYYDDALRGLVGERTAWICERFGYRF
jgi:hypothetical protein